MVKVEVISGVDESFYAKFGCPKHHFTLCEMQPFHFSFNSPASACHTCLGVGKSYVVEPRFLIVAPEKSINKGALKNTVYNINGKDSYRTVMIYSLSQKYDFSLDTPFRDLPKRERRDPLGALFMSWRIGTNTTSGERLLVKRLNLASLRSA